MNSRPFLFRVLTVAWMALIFFLSSRSDVPAPDLFWQQDKVFHLFLFGVLGLLLAFSSCASIQAAFYDGPGMQPACAGIHGKSYNSA